MSDAERFVKLFTERWRQPQPDRLADLQHAEGKLLHPGMERPIGREEIPDYVARLLSVIPDLRLEPKGWAAKDDKVFIEWTMSGTWCGRRLQWEGVTRFTLRGDRAVEGVGYFDTFPLWTVVDPSLRGRNLLAAASS